jgi:integrase
LKAAGIPRVDERGHVAVFHSLRHTFGTWLWETGANPRVIQQIRAQISGKTGQILSQAGETKRKKGKLQVLANECVSRAVAGLVACGQMVRAAGFEPATPSV